MHESPRTAPSESDVGHYVITTYPPTSVWTPEAVAREALPALDAAPADGVPLGLYVHLPFCRTRCHFCHFRVDTDRSEHDVARYVDLLAREWDLYGARRAVAGRPVSVVYIGGGTPSYLSTSQLTALASRLTRTSPWADAEEVTFEAEPGTVTKAKLAVIRELGVTRLSLGVENFGAAVLELNGRGHGPAEAARAYAWARGAGFPQINIDLIAGMLGETDENWRACIEKTLELEPDSVTIYQMELPSSTAIAADTLKGTGRFSEQVAPWATRRRWVREAFDALEQRGYTVGSAYTAVKDPAATRFVYRDRVCQGADLVGLGVASFGYVNGVHLQNLDASDAYDTAIGEGALPLGRAYQPTAEERMIRELVLQLKRGSIRPAYFQQKFDVDVLRRFPSQFAELRADGYLTSATPEGVTLSRGGLLRVDALLPRFFLPAHAGAHPA